MATTKTPEPTDTTTAHVIVTPGGEGTKPDGDGGETTRTQVMDRAQYAERLAAGASPVNDTVLADRPDATVAIVDPTPETSPAPAVVAVPPATADKADGTNAVQVKAPARATTAKAAPKAKR